VILHVLYQIRELCRVKYDGKREKNALHIRVKGFLNNMFIVKCE